MNSGNAPSKPAADGAATGTQRHADRPSPTPAARRVAAVVVTYHPEDTALSHIVSIGQRVAHVFVVDNSAVPAERQTLAARLGGSPERFTLLLNESNRGIAAALNQGFGAAAAAGFPWVLTLDQDSVVPDDMIDVLSATYDRLPPEMRDSVGALVPILRESPAPDAAPQPSTLEMGSRAYREVWTGVTSGMLVPVEVWRTFGGFDERLFIDYVDHDFCFRLRAANRLILECTGAHLIHKIGHARHIRWLGFRVAVDQHPPIRSYYIMRNGLLFWSQYNQPRDFIRADKINTLRLLGKAVLVEPQRRERLRMLWRGLIDYRRKHFGPYEPPPRSGRPHP